jgi:hypothetical protein
LLWPATAPDTGRASSSSCTSGTAAGASRRPAEGIWSLLKRHLADFAAADLAHLTRVIKRKLKKLQYRPHLIDGCLPPTGLIMDYDLTRSSDSVSST